MIKM
jgi:hypothetical protein